MLKLASCHDERNRRSRKERVLKAMLNMAIFKEQNGQKGLRKGRENEGGKQAFNGSRSEILRGLIRELLNETYVFRDQLAYESSDSLRGVFALIFSVWRNKGS